VVAGAFFDFGHDVCVDKNDAKIAALEAGRMPNYEPRLEQLVAATYAGQLAFTTDLTAAAALMRCSSPRARPCAG
jgi:UDPglucose 6-dehydrogenase